MRAFFLLPVVNLYGGVGIIFILRLREETHMKTNKLKWLNAVGLAATVAVNALANIIPIGIGTTGDVSKKYPSLFTPAPITFSVWGVIYLMMTLFIVRQWGLFTSREDALDDTRDIGLAFVVSCLMNIGWIFAWHFDVIWLSSLFIIGLLISLAVIGKRIKKTERRGFDYFAVNVGFDLYFGWVIAATIANIAVTLVSFGLSGTVDTQVVWTCAIIAVGAIIGGLPSLVDRKWFASLGVAWAYIGIIIKQNSVDGQNGDFPVITVFAIVGIAIIALCIAAKSFLISSDNK